MFTPLVISTRANSKGTKGMFYQDNACNNTIIIQEILENVSYAGSR